MSNLIGLKILIVDDELSVIKSLTRSLSTIECEVIPADSGKTALEFMTHSPVDIVISDRQMPEMTGEELLAVVASKYPDTIRLMLTGHVDLLSVIQSVNQGKIWGYLQKPWDNAKLIMTLEQAVTAQKILSERALLKNKLRHYQRKERDCFEGIVGSSAAMQLVYEFIEQSAPSTASVMITGASGTGKELVAQAIHTLSARAKKPLVVLNCAAIPSELMESEIFGHVKGSFTGAISNREGAATKANGGTLFLDELGEMDISLQSKLLRFIQTGTYQRIGSEKIETADIRFISATNVNPIQAIEEKKMREDLYYRLNVISIQLPSLIERDDDVIKLGEFWLNHFNTIENKAFTHFADDAKKLLLGYSWPGNVRQLQHVIHSYVILNDGPVVKMEGLAQILQLTSDDIRKCLREQRPITHYASPDIVKSDSMGSIIPLHQIERMYIENAIELCSNNIVQAASGLGVSPSTLYRKIQSWQEI